MFSFCGQVVSTVKFKMQILELGGWYSPIIPEFRIRRLKQENQEFQASQSSIVKPSQVIINLKYFFNLKDVNFGRM